MVNLPPTVQALSGAVGSVVANAVVYPLDTATARVQTAAPSKLGRPGPYASLLSAFRTIHREGGLDSFFLGIVPDSLSTFISSFLYFFAYTTLRDRTIAWRSKKLSRTAKGGSATTSAVPVLSALEELGIGCLAGLLAKAVVSPLSNITVRAQTSTKPNPPPAGEHIKTGLVQGNLKEGQHTSDDEDEDSGGYGVPASSLSIAKDIIDEKGWLGLWSGYSSSVLLTINPSLTFYLFEIFKRILIPRKHRHHPTPLQTFFTSAVASSIASALTYPLILSKIRLQFKSPSGRRVYCSNLDFFRKTVKKSGLKGLYVGLSGQVLKNFFSEGIRMMIKDRLQLVIVLLYRLGYWF